MRGDVAASTSRCARATGRARTRDGNRASSANARRFGAKRREGGGKGRDATRRRALADFADVAERATRVASDHDALGAVWRARAMGFTEGFEMPTVVMDATARSFEALAPRIDAESGVTPLSFVKRAVELAQDAMGLLNGERQETALPTGEVVRALEDPVYFVENIANTISREAEAGAIIDDQEWTKVLKSVDVDIGLLLASVVLIVPLFNRLKVSPVLGFLGIGLVLNRAGLFIENQEVDQFCELGIQFLLFEMGLELSSKKLSGLAKYAFGLGLTQVLFVNLAFASALLPAGEALGTKVLEFIQPGNDEMLQVSSVLEAVVIGFALSLSSSAFGLQLLADRKMLTTKFGTASLGVLLFQDLAVVPFIILLPVLQSFKSGGADGGVDVPILAAGGATSFLDLGVLAFGGRQLTLLGFRAICRENCTNDVFVAMSLLVLFGFSFATSAIGFSDSLGAFLAGIILADTPYSHTIIRELQAFKGLFLSLFFVTIGTTIDFPLFLDLWPIALAMTLTLMASKTAVITALGPAVGLTWREALVAGAFLCQGGEFAFVIFGQATSGSTGSLFPMGLDELLVIVVILSMALTPLAVDAALAIAGADFMTPEATEDEDAIDVAIQVEGNMEALDIARMGSDRMGQSVDESADGDKV